ncbi:MAG TPA: xanthine dehydrogenase family protein molybdopterin-binding subunit [Planctomycetota bacterium]|nr:xanthine dehydrogenase family protein molybdopterin-binding subunit [Planctomycetota bacterium]
MSASRRSPGGPVRRKEDLRFITGGACFVDDIHFPDALHVEVLRSRHARARLLSLDVSRALEVPGVLAAHTHADLRRVLGPIPVPGLGGDGMKAPAVHALAEDEVSFAGEPVAAVVAESRSAAADALERLDVRYQPLPSLLNPAAALAPGAPRVHETLEDNVCFLSRTERGDLDGAFRKADRTVRLRIETLRRGSHALETRSIAARHEPARGELRVWASTPSPHALRASLALSLGLAENAVRVTVPDIGMGPSARACGLAEEALLGALALIHAPRPVKWIESRRESLTALAGEPGGFADVEAALEVNGRVLAVRCGVLLDLGAYPILLWPAIARLEESLFRGYGFPASALSLTGVFTNNPPSGAFSGEVLPEALLAVERVLDMGAAELELDPAELRRANFSREPLSQSTRGVHTMAGRGTAFESLLDLAAYRDMREEQAERRRRGDLVGIGLSSAVESAATGPAGGAGPSRCELARVRVGPTGKVNVHAGVSLARLGLETILAEAAADVLGVSSDDVRVDGGDTAMVPDGTGAADSLAASAVTLAVLDAARRVERSLRKAAAALLHVPEEYVEHAGDRFAAGERSVGMSDVCFHVHRGEPGPGGEMRGLEETALAGSASLTLPFSAHVSMVSVDRDSGEARVERHFALETGGRVVHPLIAEGQAQGAVARGIAWALLGGPSRADEAYSLEAWLPDIATGRASETPRIHCHSSEAHGSRQAAGPRVVGGAGAVGAAAAVQNAVVDALSVFGVRHVDMPLGPEKLWRLIATRPAGGETRP